MKRSSRWAKEALELPAGLVERAIEEQRIHRRLRLAFLVAVVAHFALFSVDLPSAEQPPEPDTDSRPIVHLLPLPPLRPPDPPQTPRITTPAAIPVPVPIPPTIEPLEPEPSIRLPEPEVAQDDEPALVSLPSPPAPGAMVPIKVGGDIQAPRKLFGVTPDYPRPARQAHWEGNVILEVILDRSGTVRSVQVLRPQPFGLTEAAVEAVRQWRYEPVVFRGSPVEAVMTVTVQFRLQ